MFRLLWCVSSDSEDVKMSSLLLRSTGELQPGPGEYALASHYAVCSTVTTEPAFSIPGGRGIGSSK